MSGTDRPWAYITYGGCHGEHPASQSGMREAQASHLWGAVSSSAANRYWTCWLLRAARGSAFLRVRALRQGVAVLALQ